MPIEYLGKRAPEMKDLNFLKNQETTKTFSLRDKISGSWRKIGDQLGMESNTLNYIDHKNYTAADKFGKVINRWKEDASALPGKIDYPYTWEGLRTMLVDIEMEQVAVDFFEFLKTLQLDCQTHTNIYPQLW